MTRNFLNIFDAAWFYVEKRDAPAHFGPLLILSAPEGAPETYVGDLVAQWRDQQNFAAPFNYVLRKKPIPSWEVLSDDQIDLDYHLRHIALPAPGGERELRVLVSHLQSVPLDRKRPLWECHVIEGLADGRFAIYLKFHHGQFDGMGAAQLIGRIFTPDPAARGFLPPWSVGIRGNGTGCGAKATAGAARPTLRTNRIRSLWRGPAAAFIALRALLALIIGARTDRTGALTGPFQAPTTIFNHRIGDQRTFASQHFELARFKRAAKAADVTVNDVFLTAFGGALRRYLEERDALPRTSIVGQIPVSVRELNEAAVGNALTFVYARLFTDIADPGDRLRAVFRSTTAAKGVYRSLPARAIAPFTMLLTGPQIAQFVLNLSGRMRPSSNLVVSNLPGPRELLYFNGARVDEIYGPSVLFHGQALNVTMSSYAGQADIAFTACSRSLPHVEKLAAYTGEVLREIERALGIAEAPEPAAPVESSTHLETSA